jgi:hypothetical protein
LSDPALGEVSFRYNGWEYQKEDFLADISLILLGDNFTDTQRSVLAGLSPDRRQRLEMLTGCSIPKK